MYRHSALYWLCMTFCMSVLHGACAWTQSTQVLVRSRGETIGSEEKYPISHILYPLSSILYPISYILYPISYILYPISYLLYPISYTLYPISYILYPISFILYPMSYTLYPISYILHSQDHPCYDSRWFDPSEVEYQVI